MGFAFFVWWKRLPARLMADIAIVGLLPAFSIGRIGCTVVSDHVGAAVDPTKWYAFLAMDYPRYGDAVMSNSGIAHLAQLNPGTSPIIPAWNLGFIELLYLIPVNALILYLAFRRKRPPAGLLVALTGVLYAPVRFFLEYLRPETSDPRYLGMTFAQWSSLLAFGAAAYLAIRLIKTGKAAETLAPTSREAQAMLGVVLKEEVDPGAKGAKGAKGATSAAKSTVKKADLPVAKIAEDKPAVPDALAEAKRQREEQEEAAAAERRRKQDEALEAKAKAAAAKAAGDKAAADASTATGADAGKEPAAGDEPADAKPATSEPTKGSGKKPSKK